MAEWLHLGMLQSGLSQTALADKAGVSRATVNRLAQRRQDAEQQTIKRLAKAMKYPFPDFDVAFSGPPESSAKRDSEGPGVPQAARSVRENASGYAASDAGDENAAFLAYRLETLRTLGIAERDQVSVGVKLLMLQEYEEVGVERFGERARAFAERLRQRLQRGEPLGPDGAP